VLSESGIDSRSCYVRCSLGLITVRDGMRWARWSRLRSRLASAPQWLRCGWQDDGLLAV